MYKARRTTYTTNCGDKQPCIKVVESGDNGRKDFIRFSPYYRLISRRATTFVEKYCDGQRNAYEELSVLWEDMTPNKAIALINRGCI